MPDQRDVCGCHKGCTTLPHACRNRCRWPSCLTPEQQRQLAEEVDAALLGDELPAPGLTESTDVV